MEQNEKIEIYGNGPLPLHLKERAYFTAGKREFALRKSDALEYLDWCKSKGFPVRAYEVWYATAPGPTVPVWTDEADADKCRDVISQIDVEAEKTRVGLNSDVVFNIWVDAD